MITPSAHSPFRESGRPRSLAAFLSLFALGLTLVWHAVIIFRFTPLARKRALSATKGDVRDRIRLMNANLSRQPRRQ